MAALPQSRLSAELGRAPLAKSVFFRHSHEDRRSRLISRAMRIARCFWSLSALVALGAVGCGGNPPPDPSTATAQNAQVPPQVGEHPQAIDSDGNAAKAGSGDKPAKEADGWAGEDAAKHPDAKPAAAGDAPPADPKAPETRSMDVIRKLVMDNRKAARKCYEDARKDLKDLKGDVVIHFVLDPEGKVKSAELNQERSTLKSPAVSDCVIGVVKSIPFPKSSRGMETSTNYPFNFTP